MPLLYEQLRAYLLDEIRSGRLGPGDRIPSEMALAEQFNVSRITSKKALETLEHDGLIVRFRGKGSFVVDNASSLGTIMAHSAAHLGQGPTERTVRSNPTIGFVLPYWSDVFGTGVLLAIEERCAELGYALIIKRSYGRRDVEENAISTMVNLGVHGLIMFPVHGEYYNDTLLRVVLDGFPVVLVDRYLKGIAVSSVGTNNYAAAQELTNLLIDRGHTNLAFLSLPPERTSSIEDRRRGFGSALRHADLRYHRANLLMSLESTLSGELKLEQVAADKVRVRRFLDEHPEMTGFVACEYPLALILQQVLEERGQSDLVENIVCFDAPASPLEPTRFAHVLQNERSIGRATVDLLTKAAFDFGTGPRIDIPYQVVARGASTDRVFLTGQPSIELGEKVTAAGM